MIFLPALDWLIVGGMVFAIIFVVLIALLVNPPTALVSKIQDKAKGENKE
ncbi:MAG TPA: hypothetical protein VFQ91_09285 [Bryobacteraceae bacterium]|nr:hypothetical protein [Bryobacteraceae bacterium]